MVVEITEIRIKLMEGSEDRLRAFCSITIDQSFVVRDLKIIDGSHGPFVAMPSRKLTGHCNRCGSKNHLRASFCNQCGAKLFSGNVDSPQKLYADVAHPINSECREMIQNAVIEEFNAELQRSAQPNYRSRYDDDFDAGDYDEADYADANVSTSNASTSPNPSKAKSTIKKTPLPGPATISETATEPPINDAFGAGLFDNETPAETTQSDTPASTDAAAATEATSSDADDTDAESSQTDPASTTARIDEKQNLQAPNFASDAKPSRQQSDQDQTERTDDAKMTRAETGVRNTIPRPHFQDRRGGSNRQTITNTPPSTGMGSVDTSSDSPDSDDNMSSGFGAGILDD
ncbi:SpoVG family protein [Rhodopirellula sp. SWK7]|uniref:SpoVG family protein n=1 Tax=Rhodopirellula sp. SWK7 TaxID=595460 RepID=UPI0002C00B02|nr:SpoVG family protein [Rhodopirellula sp. SWK7]EMI43256.1 Sporulation stage V, protein G [Rhodopirellula sp. SWK7]